MIAPLHLPQEAEVTAFTVFFSDNTSANIEARFIRRKLSNGDTYGTTRAEVTSSGDTGYGSGTDDSISFVTIDNTEYSYLVRVGIVGGLWNSGLRIMGAVITYTIAEAP